jgi:hypothetical protein
MTLVETEFSPQRRKERKEVIFYLAACLREAASA